MRAPHGETLGWVRRQSEGEMWARAFTVVPAGRTRRGPVSRLRTGWGGYFQQALGHRDCPGCLGLGPGASRAGEWRPRVWERESLIRGVVERLPHRQEAKGKSFTL